MLLLFKSTEMTRSFTTSVIILFINFLPVNGQVTDSAVGQTGDLSLRIKSIAFIKNNEYTSPVIEGYTLTGFFFHPELVYSPSGKITLRAGTHLFRYR
jgi:hypothetical protein